MEAKEFIRTALESIQRNLEPVLDGLTQAEVKHQPAQDLHSIGLILFHTARSEDFFVQELMRGKPQVWEKSRWYVTFNVPIEERGRHYKAEQVNAFVSPDLGELRGYFVAVRRETLDYLGSLNPEDFHRNIKTPRGETTVGGFFSNIISHAAQHTGEMSYLRGLQRGLNK